MHKTYIENRVFKLFENGLAVLPGVLKVTFTKHCTCAPLNPVEASARPGARNEFFITMKSEPYNAKACLGKKANPGTHPATLQSQITKKSQK